VYLILSQGRSRSDLEIANEKEEHQEFTQEHACSLLDEVRIVFTDFNCGASYELRATSPEIHNPQSPQTTREESRNMSRWAVGVGI
jgi:hypothetical protein